MTTSAKDIIDNYQNNDTPGQGAQTPAQQPVQGGGEPAAEEPDKTETPPPTGDQPPAQQPVQGGGEPAAEEPEKVETPPPTGDQPPAPKPKVEKAEPAEEEEPDPEAEDQAFIESMNKRFSTNFETMEELKDYMDNRTLSEEEKEERKKQKYNDAVAYAVKNNIVSPQDIAAHTRDSSQSPRDFMYNRFAEAQKQMDATVTPEQIEERFAEMMGENNEEGHWMRDYMLNEAKVAQNAYLSDKYNKLLNIESVYDDHVKGEQDAKKYLNTLDRVFKDVDTISATIEDDELPADKQNYNFKFSDKDLEAVREAIKTPEMFRLMQASGFDSKAIKETVTQLLIANKFSKIVKEMAKTYASEKLIKAKAGRQGVVPDGAQDLAHGQQLEQKPKTAREVVEQYSGS